MALRVVCCTSGRTAGPCQSFGQGCSWQRVNDWGTLERAFQTPAYTGLSYVKLYTIIQVQQGCISCGILVSGIRAHGVSSEHMENMEMFSCSPTQVRSDSQRT